MRSSMNITGRAPSLRQVNLFLELFGTLFPLDHHHSGLGTGLTAPEEGDLIVFGHDPFLRNGNNGRHSFSEPGSRSGGFSREIPLTMT